MPGQPGPMSWEECMARTWPGISDKEAFCAAMKRGELHKRAGIDVGVTVEIKKLDHEQRKAYGWVAIVEDARGEPLIDHDGHVIPIHVLEKAVHEAFAASGGSGKGGDLHQRQGLIDVIEGVVVTAEKRKAPGSPFAPEGPAGWWAGFRVNDDQLWQQIKSGERPELSLRGSGTGVQLAKRMCDLAKAESKILIQSIDLNKLEWFSTVDRGASGDDKPEHRPRIVLWKRRPIKANLSKGATMTPEILEILQKLDPEEQAAILAAIEGAKPAPKAPPAPPSDQPQEKPDMAKRQDIPEDIKAELAKRDEAVKQAEEKRVEMQKRLDALEEQNVTMEIAKRFDSEMAHLPGKRDEWIEMIKSARKGMGAEAAKKLEDALIAVNKAMVKSPLLKSLGVDGAPQSGDAEAEVIQLTKKMQDADPAMTELAARQKLFSARPELYKRYRDEKNEQAAG